MKVLFVHHVADMYGASQSLLRLCRALIREGHAAVVILQEDGPLREALASAGARVHIAPDLPVLHRNRLTSPRGVCSLVSGVIRATRRIESIARDEKPDLIHSNTATILPVAGRVAKRCGIPYIQHYRESFHDFAFLWPVYRTWILRYAGRVISISDYLARQFTETQRSRVVRVARNGIPVEDFAPPLQDAVDAFRIRWKLRRPVVTLIGRIKLKRKGQEVFVAAAACVHRAFPDAMFVIAGDPFPGNESHLIELKRMVTELGLDGCVVFTGHARDVRVVLANSDVSVMASSTPEPLGNVTMESMAMGVPVVGTAIGGTPELIQDGMTGFLVPPSDPEAMSNAITSLLGDRELSHRIAGAGRRHFVDDLSFDPFYRRIKAIYEELLTP